MMFDPEYAISLYFNGDEALTQADIDQLSDWIEQSPENSAKFVRASFIHRTIHDLLAGEDMKKNILLDLQETAVSGGDTSDDSSYMQALEELAEAEKSAVGVVVEKAPDEPDEKEAFLRSCHRKSQTGHWRRFFLKAACIFLVCMSILLLDNLAMFLQTRFTPKPPPVVAQLIDKIDAEWDYERQIPFDDGQMLQDTYRLTKGLVSIRFDGGAKITVEAPAEWSLQSGGNMELFEGRIYAVVGQEARGFTITAGNTKIVDRGTEFGVEVNKNNAIQLHIIKGKTLPFYGLKKRRKREIEVNQGTEFGVEVNKNNAIRLHVIKGKTLLFYGLKKRRKCEIEVNQGQARQVDSKGEIRWPMLLATVTGSGQENYIPGLTFKRGDSLILPIKM